VIVQVLVHFAAEMLGRRQAMLALASCSYTLQHCSLMAAAAVAAAVVVHIYNGHNEQLIVHLEHKRSCTITRAIAL
jgi:radical SAM superfamily enzyme with C-terminal helix-hairpin-helix motif